MFFFFASGTSSLMEVNQMIQIILTYYVCGVVLAILGGVFLGFYAVKHGLPFETFSGIVHSTASYVCLDKFCTDISNQWIKTMVTAIAIILIPFEVHWTIWYTIKAIDSISEEEKAS